jgi:predicted ATPase
MRSDLPSGTVTFLFTDVEGSTKLLHELGAEAYDDALLEHRRALREAFTRHGGVEVDTQGDAFFYAFPTADGALLAAGEGQAALADGPIVARMGLHTGTPHLGREGYIGDDVHLGARIAATSHGGQVVVSAATAELVELELTDLGEHRLKDIPQVVPIYQLGDGAFPPLKTISNTNLPRPASSFVGRERETEEVVDRLKDTARLVTLSGPGGSGKTRLSIEAASELVPDFKAGVFWIGLATLRDSALVTETIAQTLGAKDGLADHIGEREMLLLLDNLEQVIDSAPELGSLLEACPNLKLLVTSRELLRIRGEVEYAVPPLAEPEAVSLFCERSQLEADETIAGLCQRLDNLPLAVELAAARTSVLTPQQILDRLSQRLDLLKGGRDSEARQQTLRATIEWSYQLLSPEEQQLFARLSVFAGGCTVELAEAVCYADLDTLQSLVEKSLLRFSEGRYWMLETIREYAAEALTEAETQQRYRDHFAALASRFGDDHVSAMGDAAVMEQLAVETANLREALRQLLDLRDGEQAAAFVAALAPYWHARGQFHEGLAAVEAVRAFEGADDLLRSRILSAAADFSWAVGDLEGARVYANENVELAERLGEPRAIAQALHDLAEIVTDEGDFERAKELYEEALRRARQVGYPGPGSIGNLSLIAFAEGDYERARELALQATAIFRERNNELGYATGLLSLACTDLYLGHTADARSSLRESLAICAELRYDSLAVSCLRAAAAILARDGRPRDAACLLGASERLIEEMGMSLETTERRMDEDTRACIRRALGTGETAAAWESGRGLSLDEARSLALENLG